MSGEPVGQRINGLKAVVGCTIQRPQPTDSFNPNSLHGVELLLGSFFSL